MDLDRLLASEGLQGDEVLEWARIRAQTLVGDDLGQDLASLLAGNAQDEIEDLEELDAEELEILDVSEEEEEDAQEPAEDNDPSTELPYGLSADPAPVRTGRTQSHSIIREPIADEPETDDALLGGGEDLDEPGEDEGDDEDIDVDLEE